MTRRQPLFATRGLRKAFDGLTVTDGVSIEVEHGQVHALVGPNGAGKSTLVNLLSGLLPADAGMIELDGRRLERMAPHARVRAGMSRCFQVTSIFADASVFDNLRLAAQAHTAFPCKFWGRRDKAPDITEHAITLARQVGLEARLHDLAGMLPHGAKRQLDVALALAARPKLLLLDEPMAGMGPDESGRMALLIEKLRHDTAILLIEHDMQAVFRLADKVSVLVYGRILACADPDSIRNDERVRAAYLGSETGPWA